MGLVSNRPVDGPACHVFIVGVSEYPYRDNPDLQFLALQNLSCAARSAHDVYQWMLDKELAVPLASVRLLLSPLPEEQLEGEAHPCTLENFVRDAYEWRRDAARDANGIALFYFAGHGFSLSQGEQLLLLRDIGDGIGPLLRNAVSVNNIVYGMAPGTIGDIARTQLYFIDANRMRLTSLPGYQAINATAVFDASLTGMDSRTAPVFYATAPNSAAFADAGEKTLFSRALIEALDGAAADATDDGRWCVSAQSLARFLPMRVNQLANEHHVKQSAGVEGSLGDAVIRYVSAPSAEVTLEFDAAQPVDARHVELLDYDGKPVRSWDHTGPSLQVNVPAGLYQVHVSGTSEGKAFRNLKVLHARPFGPNVLKISV